MILFHCESCGSKLALPGFFDETWMPELVCVDKYFDVEPCKKPLVFIAMFPGVMIGQALAMIPTSAD